MFISKIKEQLRNFTLEKALALSDEMHEFELKGGHITKREDYWWSRLTWEIQTPKE